MSRAPKLYGERHVAETVEPAFYFRVLLSIFSKDEEGLSLLLEDTGIESTALPLPNAEIRVWQLLRLTDNLTRHRPDWGAEISSVTYTTSHGPITVACTHAPTLGDSMKAIARYVHLRAPYFRLRTGQRGDRIALVLEPLVEMNSEKRRPLLESVLLSFQGLIETALQRPMSEGMFDIAGPGTPAASRYSSLFHAPVRFDAPETTVAMPSESLPVPNPLADPRAFADAISELDAMERHFLQGAGIVDRVERALEERDDEPSLGDIAASLKVSPRTLERLLRNSQTSFRALLEERRRRHAERLLRDETLTIAEVAYRLGFADPANFTRACRRWFGISPSGYRGLGTMPTDA